MFSFGFLKSKQGGVTLKSVSALAVALAAVSVSSVGPANATGSVYAYGTDTVAADGTYQDQDYARGYWMITTSTGGVLATSDNPNGWSVTYTSSTFTISAPYTAPDANCQVAICTSAVYHPGKRIGTTFIDPYFADTFTYGNFQCYAGPPPPPGLH